MFLNYVNSDDIWGQINVNRLIYRTSTLYREDSFVHQVGARVREATGEVRATSFLIQRLAIDVQRGNAASMMATIPATKDWGEVGRLLTL